jgi:hypothetical protein
LSLLFDCSPHRTRKGVSLPPTGPAAVIKSQLINIRKSIAPRAMAKLRRPAGLQPIQQIHEKARVQGKELQPAKTIVKARRRATVAYAKAKSGHGSPGVLKASKAARKAARELKKRGLA